MKEFIEEYFDTMIEVIVMAIFISGFIGMLKILFSISINT